VAIIQEFIEVGRPNRPGTAISPRFVTVHNTSNTSPGADAKAHSRFVRNTGYYMVGTKKNWVSWHFTVDDNVAIQHLPISEKGWHAGAGNAESIGVEICMNAGIDQQKAFDNAALLIGSLLRDLGLETASAVRTHQSWTGKSCPTLLLKSTDWNAFIQSIELARNAESDQPVVAQSELDATKAAPEAQSDAPAEEFDIDHDALLQSSEYRSATDCPIGCCGAEAFARAQGVAPVLVTTPSASVEAGLRRPISGPDALPAQLP
jgi:N-acetylmuramoyl-L-alanine amidase CwlA